MKKVAFQGEPGAYSEQAILERYSEVETLPCETFEDAFNAVEEGRCDEAFIPIENSLAGSVHQNYDLLLRHRLYICGEYFLRVRHCLIALPGVSLEEIRRVISHPQALAQCAANLRALGLQIEAAYDTAGSVKILKERQERSLAAIASRHAAELYGMKALREDFEDNPENYTRFLIVAPQAAETTENAKVSIVFALHNQPGALFKALSVFALRDINLTKIESRPLAGKPWKYLFYLDFHGSTSEKRIQRALEHLREYAVMLRVLGCYPRFQ